MEKLPEHQEYRNELAKKLKETRYGGEKTPEAARAKAEGYLEATQESPEYQSSREAHLKDIKNFLPTEPESILKFLERTEPEEERVIKVAQLIESGSQVPQDIVDTTFEYVKGHYRDSSRLKHMIWNSKTFCDFLESTGRVEEVVQMYVGVGSNIEATSLAEKAGLLDVAIKLREKAYEEAINDDKRKKKSSYRPDYELRKLAPLLEQAGRKEEAKKLWEKFGINYKILECALDDNDLLSVQKIYDQYFSPEETIPIIRAYRVPHRYIKGIDTGIIIGPLDNYDYRAEKLFGHEPTMDMIKLVIRAAVALDRQKDVDEWKKLGPDDMGNIKEYKDHIKRYLGKDYTSEDIGNIEYPLHGPRT